MATPRARRITLLHFRTQDGHAASGTLCLHTAFSRETSRKVYVQHRMKEPPVATSIRELLHTPNCHVYIAGAAGQMPKDVLAALRAALVGGGLDNESAKAMLARMEAERRIQMETW